MGSLTSKYEGRGYRKSGLKNSDGLSSRWSFIRDSTVHSVEKSIRKQK